MLFAAPSAAQCSSISVIDGFAYGIRGFGAASLPECAILSRSIDLARHAEAPIQSGAFCRYPPGAAVIRSLPSVDSQTVNSGCT